MNERRNAADRKQHNDRKRVYQEGEIYGQISTGNPLPEHYLFDTFGRRELEQFPKSPTRYHKGAKDTQTAYYTGGLLGKPNSQQAVDNDPD